VEQFLDFSSIPKTGLEFLIYLIKFHEYMGPSKDGIVLIPQTIDREKIAGQFYKI